MDNIKPEKKHRLPLHLIRSKIMPVRANEPEYSAIVEAANIKNMVVGAYIMDTVVRASKRIINDNKKKTDTSTPNK